MRHDVEANGFFVRLAAAGRDSNDSGLYHWLGEAACRAASDRDGSPPSDGWGRYLFPHHEALFDLEWDRGTEHARRIRIKAESYLRYFRGRVGADRHHVLFVVPTPAREDELYDLINSHLPRAVNICRFWIATDEALRISGVLAPVWRQVDGSADRRYALKDMPGLPRKNHPASDCIGKPRWWERRPGGGEGA